MTGPSNDVVVASLKRLIKDIDHDIAQRRAEQKGLEAALMIALGQAAVAEPEKEPDK